MIVINNLSFYHDVTQTAPVLTSTAHQNQRDDAAEILNTLHTVGAF